MVDRQRMIELLEQSEMFYEVQYGEAKIVANVSTTLSMLCTLCIKYFSSTFECALIAFA